MQSLKSLSITNCHNLEKLPPYLGNLKSLQILRLSACPSLKMLPPCTSDLASLKFLDISQCVNLKALPEGIGKLSRLEKIDMRECLLVKLPYSAASLEIFTRSNLRRGCFLVMEGFEEGESRCPSCRKMLLIWTGLMIVD
ncbi:hypothetical protein OIU78_016086 [Salix suchowensis]|nr:hypothetical protein OIU78_016086 [Salix suchowensis]